MYAFEYSMTHTMTMSSIQNFGMWPLTIKYFITDQNNAIQLNPITHYTAVVSELIKVTAATTIEKLNTSKYMYIKK